MTFARYLIGMLAGLYGVAELFKVALIYMFNQSNQGKPIPVSEAYVAVACACVGFGIAIFCFRPKKP